MEANDLYEKRNFYRFRHAESVEILFKDPQLNTGSLSCDLSEGGVRIRLFQFVPVDTRVALKIRLKDEQIIECFGRVAWIDQDRFGDSFHAGLAFSDNESVVSHQQRIYGFRSHQEQLSSSSRDEAGVQRG